MKRDFTLETAEASEETNSDLNEQLLEEKIVDEIRNKKVGAKLNITSTEKKITRYSDDLSIDIEKSNDVITGVISADEEVEGTIIVIRIGEGVLSDLDSLVVTYDGAYLTETTDVEGFFNLEETTSPEWLRAVTMTGLYVFIRIPHFSQHTLTIQSLGEKVSETIGSVLDAGVYLLFITIILIAAIAHMVFVWGK